MEDTRNAANKPSTDSYLNLLMEPSFIVNGQRVVTWANGAFFQAFNLKPEEVIDKITCEEACPTHLCGTKDCPVARTGRLNKPVESEVISTSKRAARSATSCRGPCR